MAVAQHSCGGTDGRGQTMVVQVERRRFGRRWVRTAAVRHAVLVIGRVSRV